MARAQQARRSRHIPMHTVTVVLADLMVLMPAADYTAAAAVVRSIRTLQALFLWVLAAQRVVYEYYGELVAHFHQQM